MATIETVIAAVAANPGTSAGVPADHVRAIWRGVCEHVRAMLLRRRSVMINDFAHFVVQRHVAHSGTWGARVSWVPVIALLPSFSQAYGVPLNAQTNLMHQGATTPVSINATAVMANCAVAVSRHAVPNTIKDIVREIGRLVSSRNGAPLTLDMGFATVTFHSRRVGNVTFTPSFVKALNSDSDVATTISAGLAPKAAVAALAARSGSATPRGRSVGSRAGSATPTRSTTPRRDAPFAVADDVASSRVQAKTVHVPQPPAQADGGLAATSEPMRAPAAMQPDDLAASTQAADASRTAPGGAVTADGFIISPRRAAQDAQLKAALHRVASAEASPHRKRLARKLAYRRSRNQAYEDSWQQSLDERRRAAEMEAEADRRNAMRVLQKQAEEKERLSHELEGKRAEERRVQEVNLRLSKIREGTQVPRNQAPGDIFDARRPVQRIPPDYAALRRQVEERREREAREKAEAAAFGEAAWHETQEHKAEEQRRKEERRAEREAAARDFEQLIADKRQRAKAEAAADLELDRKCTGFQGFGKGGDLFKAQSVAIQRANYEMMQQRAQERREREREEKARLTEAVKRIEARDAALREQEKRAKSARQAHLREVWGGQMSEHDRIKHLEAQERRTWRDVNFLRNESSDDEDETPDRVQRVPRQRRSVGPHSTAFTPRPPSSSPRAVAM